MIDTPVPPGNYTLINTPKKLHWLKPIILGARRWSFDIETNHPTGQNEASKNARFAMNVADVRIQGISFSWEYGHSAYVPLFQGDSGTWWPNSRIWESILEFLRSVMGCAIPKIAHNGKFDCQWLMRFLDIDDIPNFTFDTMLAHSLIDEERRECSHKLKEMGGLYIGKETLTWANFKESALDHYDPSLRRYSMLPLDILYPYGCADTDMTLKLADIMAARLEAEGLDRVMDEIMMPLSWVATMSELHGMVADPNKLRELDTNLRAEIEELLPIMQEAVGRTNINFASVEQLGKLLYEDLGFEERRTDKGAYNVDAEALKEFKDKHPLIAPLIRHRRASKLLSTYVERPLRIIDQNTHRVYHSILVGQTKTGRCACIDGDTLLTTDHGRLSIRDISLAKPTRILTHEGRWRVIERIFTKGVAPMFSIELTTGERITTTADHRFNTPSGWKRLGDLEVGDEVVRHYRGTFRQGVCDGEADHTGSCENLRDIAYAILPTQGASGEVPGSAQGSVQGSLCGEQAWEQLREEDHSCRGDRQGLAHEDGRSGFADRRDSQGAAMQRVLGASKHRVPSDQPSPQSQRPNAGSRLQSGASRTALTLVTGAGGGGERVPLRSRWVCCEAGASFLGAGGSNLADSGHRSASPRAEGHHKATVLGNEPRLGLPSHLLSRCEDFVRPGGSSGIVPLRLQGWAAHLDRGGRRYSQDGGATGTGCSEERLCEVRRVRLAAVFGQDCVEGARVSHRHHPGLFGTGVVRSIDPVGERLVWDLTVSEDHSYVAQGFVSHNSENPNTQNLPRAANGGIEAKSVYIAPPGYKIVLADLVQAELVVTAHVSQEPVWLTAFRNGADLHSQTALNVFKLPCTVEEVKLKFDDKRTAAKGINFGVLYGQTEHGLADGLKITIEEARKMIEEYFNGLVELKRWIDQTHKDAIRDGYVTNPFGRRRHLPDLQAWEPKQVQRNRSAPNCWANRDKAPQLDTLIPGIELPRQLPVLQNGTMLQNAAKLSTNTFQKANCGSCPYITSCVTESYRRKVGARKSQLLREATNFIIQSTATADVSAKWWSGILLEARRHGIPISWRPGTDGGCAINLVHDEVMYVVADRYVPAYLQLVGDVLDTVYPECSIPLKFDAEVVQVWGHKHLKDHALHWDGARMRSELLQKGVTPYELPKLGG